MQKLFIESSKATPEINFSPEENLFVIKGVSSPEDVRAMYYPVIEWIKIFVDDVAEGVIKSFDKENPLKLTINLTYFNSSSAKFIFDILTELKRLNLQQIPVIVEWHYEPEDTDMKEAGSDISQLAGLDFVFIEEPKKPQ